MRSSPAQFLPQNPTIRETLKDDEDDEEENKGGGPKEEMKERGGREKGRKDG